METSVKERLIQFLKYMGISQRQFERTIGLGNGYISNLTGTIGADKLLKIGAEYPQLNLTWLILGEGDMLKDSINQEANGDNNTQIAGNNNNINPPATLDKALDEIAAQRRLVEKSQQQIDRLLTIIENITPKNK